MELHLITGAVLDVRKWKLSDMDTLLKASGRGFLPALLKVFTDCTLQVLDPGIYRDFSWNKVYEGDLYDALWQWRGMSLKEEYDFTVNCPSCRRKIELSKSVSEIERRHPTDTVLARLRDGTNRIPVEFSGGSFLMLLPTADETQALMNTADKKVSSIRQKTGDGGIEAVDTGLLKAVRMKMLSVTVDGTTLEGGKLDAWLADIDLDVGSEILSLIEEHSFGVDTAADFTCGHCGNTFSGDIPMQKSFFLLKGARH